ncbi:flagellin [Mobilicoccus massiliensis]|uniref:flagellin n=1 Tax=Mobilicoccus massiliensis TaxID=1522310 RepID=UPI0005907C77|nr:flagellin [Mobilicoccus massiliensis]
MSVKRGQAHAHTARANGVAAENLAMSESRIRDADLAKEVAQMERWKLLCQSSISMLSEANKVPQTLLKLLG